MELLDKFAFSASLMNQPEPTHQEREGHSTCGVGGGRHGGYKALGFARCSHFRVVPITIGIPALISHGAYCYVAVCTYPPQLRLHITLHHAAPTQVVARPTRGTPYKMRTAAYASPQIVESVIETGYNRTTLLRQPRCRWFGSDARVGDLSLATYFDHASSFV